MKKQVAYLQKLFYDLWNDFGSAYLIVKHSDQTRIGKRGFPDEEKKNGLILVFNNKTNNKLEWDAEGNLSCVLAFGARKEDVYIHHEDLRGVFSPDANIQLLRGDGGKEQAGAPEPDSDRGGSTQVVSMSSYRKKKTYGKE